MSIDYTHRARQHDCAIFYTVDNRAAKLVYPDGSGLEPAEFTSPPLTFKRVENDDGSSENVATQGEPTATMQAVTAAKEFGRAEAAKAETAETDKVATAVEKAKAKAVAASTPKPKGK
jgi:hypothetical protein